jgi:hypothetical protein
MIETIRAGETYEKPSRPKSKPRLVLKIEADVWGRDLVLWQLPNDGAFVRTSLRSFRRWAEKANGRDLGCSSG